MARDSFCRSCELVSSREVIPLESLPILSPPAYNAPISESRMPVKSRNRSSRAVIRTSHRIPLAEKTGRAVLLSAMTSRRPVVLISIRLVQSCIWQDGGTGQLLCRPGTANKLPGRGEAYLSDEFTRRTVKDASPFHLCFIGRYYTISCGS